MTGARRRPWLVAALVAAVVVLVWSFGFVASATERGPGGSRMDAGGTPGSMMGGSGMALGQGMGQVWLVGDDVAVSSIASARQRAALASAPSGLHPGEVIWFDNGFYVELKDAAGAAATEVIIDPVSGAVTTEPGPAMMWNTRFGMRFGTDASTTPAVSAEQAQQIADRWARDNAPGRVAAAADTYPGYYTLETMTNGQIDGMLSVNAGSGAVWAHTWHGRFLAKEDR